MDDFMFISIICRQFCSSRIPFYQEIFKIILRYNFQFCNSVLSLHSMLSSQFCKFIYIADKTELSKVVSSTTASPPPFVSSSVSISCPYFHHQYNLHLSGASLQVWFQSFWMNFISYLTAASKHIFQ